MNKFAKEEEGFLYSRKGSKLSASSLAFGCCGKFDFKNSVM